LLSDRIAEFGAAGLPSVSAPCWRCGSGSTHHSPFPPFDPFPYILLNLLLSCLAAIQAPVIMMSQNRQEARDRLRPSTTTRSTSKPSWNPNLHEKMDHLVHRQWVKLMEIQQIQMDLMEDSARRNSK
jgi:uncharacterized membrane protein